MMQNNKKGVFFVHHHDRDIGSIIIAEDRNDARKLYCKECQIQYFETRCIKLFDAEFTKDFIGESPKVVKKCISISK